MIDITIGSNALSIVDKFQIASAIGTVIAAIAAMITAIQNRKTSKQLEHEKHLMIKPLFKIKSHFENRMEKLIEFTVVNLGFGKMMNTIDAQWLGTNGVKVSVKEYINSSDPSNDYIKIKFDFSECEEKEIKGSLSLVYSDILGKSYNESVSIKIDTVYNDITEKELPILQDGLIGGVFN